jgi:hypothetical protein
MEIVLLLISLCGLAFLALRFGRDSRPSIHSREEQQAARGLVWNGTPGSVRRRLPTQLANGVYEPGRGVAHPLRHGLAAVLYRIADWLYPDASQPQRSTSM